MISFFDRHNTKPFGQGSHLATCQAQTRFLRVCQNQYYAKHDGTKKIDFSC
jgi:hypothetical protein